MKNVKIIAKNIRWDTDNEDVDLPKTIVLSVSSSDLDVDENYDFNKDRDNVVSDYVSDKISDETGYCHFGFDIDIEDIN